MPEEIIDAGRVSAVLGLKVYVNSVASNAEVSELPRGDNQHRCSRVPEISAVEKLDAFHLSRWVSGVCVSTRPGEDFGVIIVMSGGGDGYLGHRVVLDIGDGSRGTLVLVDFAPNIYGLKTLSVEGFVGRGARVEIYHVALHGVGQAVYSFGRITVAEEAEANIKLLAVPGSMSRLRYYSDVARGGALRISVGALSSSERRGDVITDAAALGEKAKISVESLGAVKRGGYLVLRGTIRGGESATAAEMESSMMVLLLDRESKGYAAPFMEVSIGSVAKAIHSAGVSEVDEYVRFYLRSRGLSDKDIELLIASGIVERVLPRIPGSANIERIALKLIED